MITAIRYNNYKHLHAEDRLSKYMKQKQTELKWEIAVVQ